VRSPFGRRSKRGGKKRDAMVQRARTLLPGLAAQLEPFGGGDRLVGGIRGRRDWRGRR
jgi:hypothetical protein